MDNMTDFISAISGIRLFNVCHYIVSLGIIFSQKGLIKNKERNQTVPVFNASFQCLKESNATEAKVLLLREICNKNYSDKAFDMKYVNETYEHIINEGLFAYYGNITKYLSIRNFAENTNFTALTEVVFDDLSKNYINNVSCSLENISFKLGISLSPVALYNLFRDYLWPVFKRTKKNFRRTRNNLENTDKRKLQIHRRLKRQVSDNDSDSSSNFDMYFSNFSANDKQELLKAADDYLFSAVTEANQFWTNDNDSNIQFQARVGTDEPEEQSVSDGSDFDFFNSLEESAEDAAVENLWPTFAESNLNKCPFVDADLSSQPKIRRIDTSTKQFSGSGNEFSRNQDEFGKRESGFQVMTNVQNNRVLGNPGFEIDVDDVPGTSTQSENARIARFLRSRENRRLLGFTDERDVSESLGSDHQQLDEDNNIYMVLQNEGNVQENSIPEAVHEAVHEGIQQGEQEGVQEEVLDDTLQEGELDEKILVHVQVDYAGRREPVYLIFRNMKIGTKSKRMQSIAKAAIIISSNEFNNYTFEDSLKMLKGYILKLEGSEGPAPTYKKLAIDFCKNNLRVPEEYNMWKIRNHPLIDDVLFETNFYVPMTEEEDDMRFFYRHFPENETFISMINIYTNSTLLQESLSLRDFLVLKRRLTEMKYKKSSIIPKRINVALYRLALRECEQEWVEKNMNLFRINNVGNVFTLNKKLHIGSNYTFDILTKFSYDKILEKRKSNELSSSRNNLFRLEITLVNSAGVVNIDRILNTNDGKYVIVLNTLKIIDKVFKLVDDQFVLILKLEDKRSKEEKMIDIINGLHQLIETNPELLKYYN